MFCVSPLMTGHSSFRMFALVLGLVLCVATSWAGNGVAVASVSAGAGFTALGPVLSSGIASQPVPVASPSVSAMPATPAAQDKPGRAVFDWDLAGEMPAPVSNPCVFLRNGRILVIGGNDERGPVSAFREFDPETRAWRRLPPMALARSGHGVAMFRDRLYVFGGIAPHRGRQQPVSSVEIFDFTAGRWETGRPLPSPRARFGIAVLRGRIYLAGGEGADGRPLSELIAFDPFKDVWERKQGLPSARNRMALAAAADSLFLFGGEGFAGRTLRTVLRYLPAEDRWVDAPTMRVPRKNIALARLGSRLVVTGGWDEKDGKREFIGETEIFDPQVQHWEDGGALLIPRDGARMIAASGRLWLFGGYAGTILSSIECGSWEIPASDWRVDADLGMQVAYFAEPDPATTLPKRLHGPTPASLGLSPDAGPDITNIRLDAFRGMGFPVPTRPDPENYVFYLKFFRYPPGLDHELTLRRVIDPLLVRQAGNEDVMRTMLASGKNMNVKKGYIGLSGRTFTPDAPFPPLVIPARPGRPQTFFDTHLPFSSLYVRPVTLPPNRTDDAALASWTAGAVATCVRDLTTLYRLSFVEMQGNTASPTSLFFLDDAGADSRLKSEAHLRLLEIPREPMCFSAFRGLPMPHDPRRLFLTGLALVREERYRVRSNPLAGTLRDAAFLRETIGSPTVHIFEIGSTIRVASGT